MGHKPRLEVALTLLVDINQEADLVPRALLTEASVKGHLVGADAEETLASRNVKQAFPVRYQRPVRSPLGPPNLQELESLVCD
jgi:hypothetical protein